MSTLLSRIFLTCPHQFSWPRRDESGTYYQWCVNCGTKYRYDWARMRRTARVDDDTPAPTRASHRQQKTTWTVRERRLKHTVPVKYRVGTGEWIEGTSENLSRSGLLFLGPTEPEIGAEIQIQLEMPEEIAGEWAEVLCKATVARVTAVETGRKNPPSFLIACAMDGYKFMKKPSTPAA